VLTIQGNSALNDVGVRVLGKSPAPDGPHSSGGGDPVPDPNLSPLEVNALFGVQRNWASIAWGFYGTALMRFEVEFNATATKNPVYGFGYDWRQSNADSGAKLAQFIAKTLAKHQGAEQVILVSHSMGGLVVRGAILADPSVTDKIRGVIHGVQPSNGAVVCYTRLLCGMSTPVEILDAPDTVVLSGIIGQSGDQFIYNMSGLPGPLQLLPNHLYQSFFGSQKWMEGLDPGDDLNDVYSVYMGSGPAGLPKRVRFAQNMRGNPTERNSGSVENDFANHMAEAKSFHQQLAGAPNAAFHPNTVVLHSVGVPTVYSVRFRTDNDPADLHNLWTTTTKDDGTVVITDNAGKIAYTRSLGGDQMVPDVSGRCPAVPGAVRPPPVNNVVHGDVYKNEAFNNLVINFIKQMLQGAPVCAENDATSRSDDMLASNDDGSGGAGSDDDSDAADDSGEDADARAETA
jgi:pimeloyl-ACP methyl ester carboxylesterase